MGSDFTALMPYGGPVAYDRTIRELELRSPPAVQRARAFQVRQQYRCAGARPRAEWTGTYGADRPPGPVELPSLDVALCLPEVFILTFGADSVCVYHVLRWHEFLTEPIWWPVIIDACDAFAGLFGADEYIVTHDEAPAVLAFRDGASYRDAIERGRAQGEPEVETIADMYYEVDDRGTWDTKGYWRTAVPGLARVT